VKNSSASDKATNDSVLIISMYFHPEPAGSAPPITDMALWMARNGLHPEVITARPNYPTRKVFEGYESGQLDDEKWCGVDVKRLKSTIVASSGLLGRLRTEGSFLWALIVHRIRSKKTASVVISVCPSIFTVLGARFFLGKQGVHLAIVHDIQSGLGKSTGYGSRLMGLLSWIEGFVLNRVDKIVTLDASMEATLRKKKIKVPITITPPQVDSSSFPNIPDPSCNLVIYSGAMGKKQGLEQLIHAAALLEARNSSAKLIIRGQGGIRSDLELMAEELKLKNVMFEDLADSAHYHEAMAAGSVHLVPQNAEGSNFALPSKLYSIMASYRPFIATGVPNSPLGRLVEKSNGGMLVPPNDPGRLADAIDELLANPGLRQTMGMSGRKFVEAEADTNVVCRHIWNFIMSSNIDVLPMSFELPSGDFKVVSFLDDGSQTHITVKICTSNGAILEAHNHSFDKRTIQLIDQLADGIVIESEGRRSFL
jgi:colanic acid biosynthesis glycosyl transferase WcaI